MDKLVSIVVPVYNGMNFIEQFIENANRLKDIEFVKFIILDNGSTDGTQKFIRNNFPFALKFIENTENIGVVGSIEKGEKNVDTPYCLYLPIDDWLHPEFLKQGLLGLEKNKNCSIAFGKSSMHMFEDNVFSGKGFRFCPYMDSGIWDGNPFRTFAIDYPTDIALARTECLKKAGGFNGGHWQSQIQFYGDIFFTGGECLQSYKSKTNQSKDWSIKGIQNERLVRFFFEMHNHYCRNEIERSALRIIFASLNSGIPLLDICKHLSKNGDMHMRGAYMRNEIKILELIKTVIWGNFKKVEEGFIEGPNNNRKANLVTREHHKFIIDVLKNPSKFLRTKAI